MHRFALEKFHKTVAVPTESKLIKRTKKHLGFIYDDQKILILNYLGV